MFFIPSTIRAKLALTAACGLALIALMTILVLQMTDAAGNVSMEAQQSLERMRAFARLQFTAHRLQTVTYQVARLEDPRSSNEQANARADFQAALDRVDQLAPRNAHERNIRAVVKREGQAVLALFADGSQIVRAVDEQWQAHGSKAAMRAVQTLSEPFFVFSNTVQEEVSYGDLQVGNAALRVSSLQHSVRIAALAGLALGLALAVAIFVLLLTRLGPGLKRLAGGARALRAGDLDYRIQLDGHDELAHLAQMFNSMAQELEDDKRELQAGRAGLEQAVALRTAELELANAALSAENERRRIFLAEASHELRIPLTIIRGESQVALRALNRGSLDATETFVRILDQTRGMTRLLEDLFLIARAEAGGLHLNRETTDISELIVRIAHDFASLACESGATVRATAQPGLYALCDRDRIRQSVAALIDNALRHTKPGVAIALEACVESSHVVVTVTDDGPGIDPNTAADLFLRFRRGQTRGEGSGLGLTVVRALAEAHGGTATLGNADQGGARAVLRLPKLCSVSSRAA
jgi:two-component system, OmpR family, sensor kinase